MEHTTWVEVSEQALKANLRAVEEYAGVPVCAVVKANGYGHGLVGAARVFVRAGAQTLAVTRVEEARALREADIAAPVLILTPPPDAGEAVALDCQFAVTSWEEIERLPGQARVHIKIDTGMGRLGFAPGEAVRAASEAASRAHLVAVWTHLADARRSGHYDLGIFENAREKVIAAGIECRFHASNSAALLALSEARFDMVRIGTLLYGENPAEATAPFALRDPFAWYARVISVREVNRSATVGYGKEWRATRRARVATLAVGYCDGVSLHPLIRTETPLEAARLGGIIASVFLRIRPSPRYVLFGETRAPVVGRVGMQSTTVLLEGLDDVKVGSIARVPARRLLVSPDIPRVYI